MGLFDFIFKKKEEKIDYSNLKLIVKDMNNQVHIKDISPNIQTKNKYFWELSLTSNSKIKFYVDCIYVWVNIVPLDNTIKENYENIIEYPTPKNGKCLKKGNYIVNLDNFLSIIDKWNLEVIKNDAPEMKYILHGSNETGVNMYMVFGNLDLYEDLVSYMGSVVKKSFMNYLESQEEICSEE